MPQSSIAYAIGSARAPSRRPLGRSDLERLISASGYDEARRQLADMGYGGGQDEDGVLARDLDGGHAGRLRCRRRAGLRGGGLLGPRRVERLGAGQLQGLGERCRRSRSEGQRGEDQARRSCHGGPVKPERPFCMQGQAGRRKDGKATPGQKACRGGCLTETPDS